MEEPRPRPVGRPLKDAPKNPIEIVYRMAWTGTVTLHDAEGNALHTIRYDRMPHEDGCSLAEALASDALALVRRCPRLLVVALGDGAEQIEALIAEHVDTESFGHVRGLLDPWHVVERLGNALAVMEPDDHEREERLAEHRRRLCTRRDAPASILAELPASGLENPAHQDCPVHTAITHFDDHAHLIDDLIARRDGLPSEAATSRGRARASSVFGRSVLTRAERGPPARTSSRCAHTC